MASHWAALGKAGLQIVHKHHCAFAGTVANIVGHDQVGIGIDCRPRPYVASAFWCGFRSRHVLCLRIAERPDFIALNARRLHTSHSFIMQGQTSFASFNQQLGNGVDRHVRNAADRTHGRTFAQHGEDLDTLGEGSLFMLILI